MWRTNRVACRVTPTQLKSFSNSHSWQPNYCPDGIPGDRKIRLPLLPGLDQGLRLCSGQSYHRRGQHVGAHTLDSSFSTFGSHSFSSSWGCMVLGLAGWRFFYAVLPCIAGVSFLWLSIYNVPAMLSHTHTSCKVVAFRRPFLQLLFPLSRGFMCYDSLLRYSSFAFGELGTGF
jgi:hypothetical protein